MKRTTQQSLQPRRNGNVLIFVAILMFALLPIASLVLQSGWLTLTRRQMQSGTDLAAVEALRGRDTGDIASDKQRREDASLVTRALYDEDLLAGDDLADGAPPDDPLRFSAGPVIDFRGGIPVNDGDFFASRRIHSFDQYDPVLEPNSDDDDAGDLLTGTYDAASNSHAEHDDYSRDDFAADGGPNAFLARMRRSDDAEIPGVVSRGPRIPFLFGRGPFGGPGIAGPGETPFMTFAERGSIVRATSIADSVPAWTVGHPSPGVMELGVAGFAVDEVVWRSVVLANSSSSPPSLTVTVDDTSGLFTSPPDSGFRTTYDTSLPVSIGTELSASPGGLTMDEPKELVYVPLTTEYSTGGPVDLVCGFVPMQVDSAGANTWKLTASSTYQPVATENAMSSAKVPTTVGSDQLDHALDRFRALVDTSTTDDVRNTLLHAPALRRAY